MVWMYELSPGLHYFTGSAEIMAGLGLILPGLTRRWGRITPAAGVGIGGVFASQLPTGIMVGSQIATQLTTMALTYMSGQQIGPPVTPPSHVGPLMSLFSALSPSGIKFAKDISDILDTWTKTWIVSGLIPGTPPIPFSGPLS